MIEIDATRGKGRRKKNERRERTMPGGRLTTWTSSHTGNIKRRWENRWYNNNNRTRESTRAFVRETLFPRNGRRRIRTQENDTRALHARTHVRMYPVGAHFVSPSTYPEQWRPTDADILDHKIKHRAEEQRRQTSGAEKASERQQRETE